MVVFIKRSSSLLLLLKKSKCSDLKQTYVLSHIAKFSSNSYCSSILLTNRKHELLSSNNFGISNCQIVSPHVLLAQRMSTGSNVENFKVTTSEFGNSFSSLDAKPPDADQVIFTNATIPDSSREISDSIATNLPVDLSSVVNAAVEPSLASLGLGSSYTPVGLIQQFLEFLHISGHLPWWICIVLATGIARMLMMPIFIKTQKNAAIFANYMPRLHYYQAKFNEARKSGNMYESSKCANDMMAYMKQHNVNPMKNALWPLAQAPVFLSFFWGLRSMAKLPVESMKVGGFSWITDLTIPDPYYILPLTASATLYVILKVGAESGVRMENMKLSRYFLMSIPIIILPFCIHFPSAILFYWCTNNFLTLGLVLCLKMEVVRAYFGIQKIRKPDIPQRPGQKKGFIASMKESYQDQKILSEVEERGRIDSIRFKKAGMGPIPRTYAYDPTKPRPAVAAKSARTSSSK